MNQLGILAAAASAPAEKQSTHLFVWEQLEGPGLAIIIVLVLHPLAALLGMRVENGPG